MEKEEENAVVILLLYFFYVQLDIFTFMKNLASLLQSKGQLRHSLVPTTFPALFSWLPCHLCLSLDYKDLHKTKNRPLGNVTFINVTYLHSFNSLLVENLTDFGTVNI